MGATSLDLSQIKTDVLSAASTFRTLIGLGNVNNTADLDKPISTATQGALDLKADSSDLSSYLPLAGGTLTGGLGGTDISLSGGVNLVADVGWIGLSNISTRFVPRSSSFRLYASTSLTIESNANDTTINTTLTTRQLYLRNSTNAMRMELYGTYTDASNYRRLYIGSTTAGAFTLGIEGLGTGASGNTLTINNALTLKGVLTHQPDVGGNTFTWDNNGINMASGRINGLDWLQTVTAYVSSAVVMGGVGLTLANVGGISTASNVLRVVAPDTGTVKIVYSSGTDAPVTASAITVSGTVSGSAGSFSNSVYGYTVSANASRCLMFNHFNVANGYGYTFSPNSTASNGSEEFGWYRDGSHTVGLIGGANAERFNIYGTRTDASNYRRLYIGSTTAGAFTLGVEGLGTGASGNTLAINTTTITTNPGYSNSQAFGSGHSMVGTGVTLIGTSINQSYSSSTVGIGYNINAAGRNSVYIGNSNTAPTPGSVVSQVVSIGDQVTTGTTCVAIGSSSSASTNSVVIGCQATDVDGGVVIGKSATGTGSQPVAIGNSAYAVTRGVAIGRYTSCGHRSIAIGDTATTTADGQIHIGSSQSPISIMSFPGSSFSRINLGDATSANPAIKRNGTAINFRLADDSADAPITAGAITTSGSIATSGSIGIGGVSALGASHPINLPVYTWINWASTAYLTADPGIGLRLNNCAIQNLTYLGFGSSNTTVVTFDANDTLAQRRSTNSQVWRLYNTFTDASNYIRQSLSFTTYSGTVYAQYIAEGAGTGAVNIPLVITPRGTGAFILGPIPDGTSTGGNARGANAIDLQILRNSASQVASGTGAFVACARNTSSGNYAAAFGFGCTASGNHAIAMGFQCIASANEGNIAGGYESTASGSQSSLAWGNRCTASGAESSWVIGYESSSTANASIAMGRNARSDRAYQYSHAAGPFSTSGDAQYTRFVLKNRTTDATPTILFGGVLPSFVTRLTIPSGKMFLFEAKIIGVRSDGLQRASYMRKGTIINVAGTTSLVGVIEAIGTDVEDNPALDMTITADDANDALAITVTGITGETWRWVAVVEGVEVAYGT